MGDRVTRIRRVWARLTGPGAVQFVGLCMALSGIFGLFGLWIFLIAAGVVTAGWSILIEGEWI